MLSGDLLCWLVIAMACFQSQTCVLFVCPPGIPLQEISRSPSAFTGRNFRNWLLELRNSHSLIKSSRSALIDRLLEGYDSARHGTGVRAIWDILSGKLLLQPIRCPTLLFFCCRFLENLSFLNTSKLSVNLPTCKCDCAALICVGGLDAPFLLLITPLSCFRVKAYSSNTSLDQHHQSAAKDLTGSPVRNPPSTIQVTYLPSTGQRSKRPKHFLELKSFKDNYNTLESTLWGAADWVCMSFIAGMCWGRRVFFGLSFKKKKKVYIYWENFNLNCDCWCCHRIVFEFWTVQIVCWGFWYGPTSFFSGQVWL